jgi:PAS domain S-box-containing protein
VDAVNSIEQRLKIAEDELRRSRESFRDLVYNNPFGLYIVDADMTLRYVSKGAEKIFAKFEPMIGHDFKTVMHTIWPNDFAAEVVEHFRHTLETGEPYFAPTFSEHRHDTQQRESYEWQLQRLVLPDGRHGVVCYFYDATERELQVEFTRRREQYFREMADAAPAMVWVTNTENQCTFLSRGWQEYTGQTEADGLGIGWLDMVHPADRTESADIILSAIERREAFAHDYRLRTIAGDYRWALDSGRPKFDKEGNFQGFVGSVIDVHDRRVAEEALRDRAREIEEGERRLRMAAETTGFGTYDYNFTSGTLLWSEEMYRITGIPLGQKPPPSRVASLIHPDDRKRYMHVVEQSISTGGPDRHCEQFRIIRPTGEVRWVIDTGRSFREGDGDNREVVRVLGTVQDITDRKIFEDSLQRAKQSAELANRSRGEFLANMSHEIRTPMTAILGHAEILKERLQDPDNLQLVRTIRRNGNFLLNIINDILDLSKIDAGKMEIDRRTIHPDAIVRDVQSLMDVRAAEKDIPLRIEFAGPIPETIESDEVRLRQILLNLVGNAIKFTDEGEVKLVVRFDEAQRRLMFEIVDTGIGIAPDKLHLLFEPFKQVDNTSTRSFGGTGLGLAICRRLANILGGEVQVESTPGRGSKFTLSLNVIGEGRLIDPELKVKSNTDTYKEDVRLSAWVLVVDDRRDIRYLAQHFIERAGGTVFLATNGQEAIDFIYTPDSPEIDLILMDMQMPVMDGYAATAELRRRGCELPIIALTAKAMKSDRDECLAAGCTDYTTKPLDHRKLIQLIAGLTAD